MRARSLAFAALGFGAALLVSACSGSSSGSCKPACQGLSCGPDGCGGTCGTCPAGQSCGANGQCGACVPSCSGKVCGSDGCGGSCGTCASGTCLPAGTCSGCAPVCTGKVCGADGCGGTCGTCSAGQSCNASGACVCVPSCSGKACGSDGCGGTCGTCAYGQSCNASGACVCTPSCSGKACGADGCGGTCGTCSGSQQCNASGQCIAVSSTVTGKVTYDFVPSVYDPQTETGTLAFAQATQKPVRNASIKVVQGATLLASATTDESGNYSVTFTPSGSEAIQIVALAQSTLPSIQVQDNTQGNAIWAMGTTLAASATTADVRAGHGWTGTGYSSRTAAPFAILDTMYTAAHAFMAARSVTYPALKVNWSPNNVPQSGDPATGQIGTSHYTPSTNQIFILGKAGVDTDEFDKEVIAHEWGHFFEHNLSRSDSPGGPHSMGERVDPRLAFGEGYGDAIASILLGDPIYSDTFWNGTALQGFGWSAETAPYPTDDPEPSVFSEMSVTRALWDLVDSGSSESYDTTAISIGTLYDVLVGPEKTTDALTTIGSFLYGLKAQSGVNATAVNTLMAHYNIGAITSQWGDGDVNLRDMYTNIASLPAQPGIYLTGGHDYNEWYQVQFYVVTGTGAQVTVSATSTYDVGLAAYQSGVLKAYADQYTTGTETMHFATESGKKYVVVLTGFATVNGDYLVSLSFTSP